MSDAEEQLIEQNLAVIRECLKDAFPDFEITEDKPHRSMYYKFTVSNLKLQKAYKLQVGWPRLSDRGNTPIKTQHAFKRDHIADQMRAADGEYCIW